MLIMPQISSKRLINTIIFAVCIKISVMKKIVVLAIIFIAMVSCSDNTRRIDDSATALPIERLDQLVYHYNEIDSATRDCLTDSMSPGLDVYLRVAGINSDSIDVDSALTMLSGSQPVKVFTPDVDDRLHSIEDLEMSLGVALRRIQTVLPGIDVSHIYGVVSPYRQSVITADSVVLVALNLYLGRDYPGYSGFEDYFRQTRESVRIPYDVIEALVASRYPIDNDRAKTILSKMLYQGALVYAVMSSIPDADLSLALGVSGEDLKWLEGNESLIWDKLIQQGLLYSSSEIDASKLLMPSPATPAIHPEAPGRVGRYVGYAIVKSYVDKHKDVTLEQLLSSDYYGETKTLIDAGYVPAR